MFIVSPLLTPSVGRAFRVSLPCANRSYDHTVDRHFPKCSREFREIREKVGTIPGKRFLKVGSDPWNGMNPNMKTKRVQINKGTGTDTETGNDPDQPCKCVPVGTSLFVLTGTI